MAKSQAFHWVVVDRDVSPELPKRFSVSAYPTLLTLGREQEKIHRFKGFKKKEAFAAELDEALRRHRLYLDGKEWDEPDPRPATICDEAELATLPAPATDVPAGLTVVGDELWVGQAGTLYRLDLRTGSVLGRVPLPPSVLDLCTDGKRIYALEGGWTAGRPIHILDPATGKPVGTVVTEANKTNKSHGAKGVAWRDGKLIVLEGMRGKLHTVDPATGEVETTVQSDASWLAGLAFDGRHFVAGSRTHLSFLDPDTGAVVRKIPVHYPLRSVAHSKGSYHVMEQPVFGHDKSHRRIQVWPQETMIHVLKPELPAEPEEKR